MGIRGEICLTHVIHGPLLSPKAICHAGSSDWKYSSGWKKVLMLNALRIRNAIRNSRISREMALLLRDGRGSCCISSSCLLALIDAWCFGVDDMAPQLTRFASSDKYVNVDCTLYKFKVTVSCVNLGLTFAVGEDEDKLSRFFCKTPSNKCTYIYKYSTSRYTSQYGFDLLSSLTMYFL